MDDGSTERIFECVKKFEKYLDIKYLRQTDKGYHLSEVNLGIKLRINMLRYLMPIWHHT